MNDICPETINIQIYEQSSRISNFICIHCGVYLPLILTLTRKDIHYKCKCGDYKFTLSNYFEKLQTVQLRSVDMICCNIKHLKPEKASIECLDDKCKNKRYYCSICSGIHSDLCEEHKVNSIELFRNFQDDTRQFIDDIDFKILIKFYWREYLDSHEKILEYIDINSIQYTSDIIEKDYNGKTNTSEMMIRFMKLVVNNYFCYPEAKTQIFNLYVIGRIFYEDFLITLNLEDNITIAIDDKIQLK